MLEPVYIEKLQPDPDGLDFGGLKQEGIELLQKLSGKAWTDFNLHDPGITILEVLCYALTDLVYRTEFEVADFLTGRDGSIDFEKQALFPPQDILPSQAVTINDYRKLIFDSVPEIENVWITPVQPSPTARENTGLQGLYCISVMLADTAPAADRNKLDRETIEKSIKDVFAKNRNLCEDMMPVEIVKPDYYSIHGNIEITGKRSPDDILAEIYFKSSKYICPALKFRSYDTMVRQGSSLEEIFTGPLTKHGYIRAEDLDEKRKNAQTSELIEIISEIEGVKFVDALWFDDGRNPIKYDRIPQSMPRLSFPENHNDIKLVLEKNGRRHPVIFNSVRVEFERLHFEVRALRRIPQDIDKVCDPPRGKYINFADYYSIQHHFPEIYGIGSQGPTDRAWQIADRKIDSDRRRARARQLKAYLLLFEQILANYLSNLKGLSRLFSDDDNLDRSYFYQLLDKEIIPAVDEIYRYNFTETDTRIDRTLRKYDNYADRRNRILDYLLGIYGESFTQNSLRRFKEYHSEHEFEHEMILNKITFLKNITELSQKRAGAFNYLEKCWELENNSTLQKKVNILLGLRNYQSRSLALDSDGVDAEGCHILEHILLRPLSKDSHEKEPPDDFYSFKISVLFPVWTRRFANKEFRKLAMETVELNCPAHVLPEFYCLDFKKMEDFEERYKHWLKLKCEDKECGGKSSDEDIDKASQELIKFLIENQQSQKCVPTAQSAENSV